MCLNAGMEKVRKIGDAGRLLVEGLASGIQGLTHREIKLYALGDGTFITNDELGMDLSERAVVGRAVLARNHVFQEWKVVSQEGMLKITG